MAALRNSVSMKLISVVVDDSLYWNAGFGAGVKEVHDWRIRSVDTMVLCIFCLLDLCIQ